MKDHKLLNKWVLMLTAAFAVLFFVMAAQVPLNYWHHSKFSFGPDYAFNDFFPFINVITNLFTANGRSPINPENYKSFSIAAALLFSLCVWFLSAVSYKKGGGLGLIAVAILLLTQANFLWLSIISLKLSMFSLGLVLYLFTHQTKFSAKGLEPFIAFIGFYLIMVSSFVGWLLLPMFFIALIGNRKSLINHAIGFVAATVLLYISNPHIWLNVQIYFDNASNTLHTFNNARVTGNDIGSQYFVYGLIRHVNLAFIVIIGLWFWLSSNEKRWYLNPSFLLIIGFALFGLLMPNTVGFALYQYLPLVMVLAVLASNVLKGISNKLGKPIALVFIVVIGLTGYSGLLSWLSFSPYQYMQSTLAFNSAASNVSENEGEYLNISGISLLNETIAKAKKGDTIATNFYHQSVFSEGTLIGVEYFEKELKQYTVGVFVRHHFYPEVQKGGAFPPEYATDAVVKNGITLAVSYKPKHKIKSAYKLLGERKIGDAVVAFKALNDTFPKNPQVWYGLARAQFEFNYWDDALKAATIGNGYNPKSHKFKTLIGEIYRKQNKNKKALKYWNQSLNERKLYGRTHWLLGEYYLRLDSFDKARGYFLSAKYCQDGMSPRAIKSLALLDSIESNPEKFKNGVAKHFISRINTFTTLTDSSKKRLKGIMNELKAYIELDSSNAQLRAHLGIAYMMLENFPQASIAFEKAVELNPNYPQMRQYMVIARTNWGASMFAKDSLEEAIFHFRYALDYDPENQGVKTNLSVAYNEVAEKELNNNNLEDAYALVKAAIYFDKENPKSFLQMGELQERINQTDSAEIAYNQAYMIDPSNIEAIETLIDFYKEKNEAYKVKVYTDRLKKVRRRNRKLLTE